MRILVTGGTGLSAPAGTGTDCPEISGGGSEPLTAESLFPFLLGCRKSQLTQ